MNRSHVSDMYALTVPLVRVIYDGPDAPESFNGHEMTVTRSLAIDLLRIGQFYSLHPDEDQSIVQEALPERPLTAEEKYRALIAKYFATCNCLRDKEKRAAFRIELAAARDERLARGLPTLYNSAELFTL